MYFLYDHKGKLSAKNAMLLKWYLEILILLFVLSVIWRKDASRSMEFSCVAVAKGGSGTCVERVNSSNVRSVERSTTYRWEVVRMEK